MSDRYEGVNINVPHVLPSYFEQGWSPQFKDGYYQPPSHDNTNRLIDLSRRIIDGSFPASDLGLQDYQDWGALNWKMPHGTQSAHERFVKGLFEEHQEVFNEIKIGARDKAIDELGDVLWYVTAISTNCGISLEEAYGRYLHQQWEPVSYGQHFSIDDIDRRMNHGFIPYVQSRERVGEVFLDDLEPTDAFMEQYDIDLHILRIMADKIFQAEQDSLILSDYIEDLKRNELSPYIGYIFSKIAFCANVQLNASLAEVIRQNMVKLSGRVNQNTVDKSDGDRA